jgi:CubicO group peptidase (beta-lactamase class C family)
MQTRRQFLSAVALAGAASIVIPRLAEASYPGKLWASRSPAQVGLLKSKLDEFRVATGKTGPGVIVKDGFLVYTWGNPAAKFEWASAAKPVISSMLFFAVKEGRLDSVDDFVARAGWALTTEDGDMRFSDLANMISGYALPEAPGQAWGYNDFDISLYNKSLFDRMFAQKPDTVVRAASRLGPLQFQDGQLYGTARGGFGLVTSPRDFARIGWWWLNKGNWRGKQLLPRSYFDFMKNQVPTDLPRTAGGTDDYLGVGSFGGGTNQEFPGQGRYGFNWWFNRPRVTWPDAPADTIQCRGHNNAESMFIIPSLRIVAAYKGKNSSFSGAFADANRYLRILTEAVEGQV